MNTQNQPFLLPQQPKLDKIAALYVWVTHIYHLTLDSVTVLFDDGQPVGSDVIDVDAISDYKSVGAASATQRVIDEHPELRDIKGMTYFASLFNHNNATGNLKNQYEANFFNLANDWPRVAHSVPRSEHMLRIVRELFPVFDTYFAAAQAWQKRVETIRNPFCLDGLQRLIDTLEGSYNADTGRGAQYVDTANLGVTTYDRLEELFELTEKADQRTNDAANRIVAELEFEISTKQEGQTMKVAVFRCDDTRMVRRLFVLRPDLGIIIMRRRKGNYGIFTRGQQDFSRLYAALELLEPGQWHYEKRYKSPMLLNGSESRQVAASQLTPSEIRNLVVEYVKYVTREQARVA